MHTCTVPSALRAKVLIAKRNGTPQEKPPKTALLNGGSALQILVVDTPDQSIDP